MSGDLTGLCLYIQEQGGGNNLQSLLILSIDIHIWEMFVRTKYVPLKYSYKEPNVVDFFAHMKTDQTLGT